VAGKALCAAPILGRRWCDGEPWTPFASLPGGADADPGPWRAGRAADGNRRSCSSTPCSRVFSRRGNSRAPIDPGAWRSRRKVVRGGHVRRTHKGHLRRRANAHRARISSSAKWGREVIGGGHPGGDSGPRAVAQLRPGAGPPQAGATLARIASAANAGIDGPLQMACGTIGLPRFVSTRKSRRDPTSPGGNCSLDFGRKGPEAHRENADIRRLRGKTGSTPSLSRAGRTQGTAKGKGSPRPEGQQHQIVRHGAQGLGLLSATFALGSAKIVKNLVLIAR